MASGVALPCVPLTSLIVLISNLALSEYRHGRVTLSSTNGHFSFIFYEKSEWVNNGRYFSGAYLRPAAISTQHN